MQATGRPTDVAIQGEGYFVVRSGSEQLYTRAGSFGFDNAGNLADPTGAIVQGWLADPVTGALSTNGPTTDIQIPLGQSIAPDADDHAVSSAATSVVLTRGRTAASTVSTAMGVVDSLGVEHPRPVRLHQDRRQRLAASRRSTPRACRSAPPA